MSSICKTNSAISRLQFRYGILLNVCFAVTMLVMAAVKAVFRAQHPVGIWAYALAVLPAIPFVACIVITGRYLYRETDEFARMLITQTLLWSVGMMLAINSTWGFITLYLGVAPPPLYINISLCYLAYGIASVVVRVRYR